jgi:cell division protein FtsL
MTPATRPRPASHAARALRRGSVPRAPRRISGPARPPSPALAGAAAARPPFALRLGTAAMRVGDARLLDRLVRGRSWIALVAIGLMGIVFMQVSLLKLNAGISRAVTAADTLERQNAALRGDISNLDSGERIQSVAAKLGMIIPAAGDVHYLDGRQADGARAAASIKPPAPVPGATTQAAAQQQPAAQQQAVAPVQQQAAAAVQQQPAATTQQQPTTTQQQPTQTAPTTQQQPATTPTGAANTASTPTGGATTASTAPPAATAPSTGAAAAGGASAQQGGTTAPQGG